MLDRFDTLVSKLLDGGLDADERDHLNQLLTTEEYRRRFVEFNKLHYCLTQRALPSGMIRTARATSAVHDSILSLAYSKEGAASETSISTKSIPLARRRMISRMSAVGAAAAVALVCCYGIFSLLKSGRGTAAQQPAIELMAETAHSKPTKASPTVIERTDGFAARVVSLSEDCAWDQDAGPSDFLMRLSVGEDLKLTRGIVKLEFASQASVVVSSPAELKILGSGEVLLTHGKITGKSDQGDFTVQTPSAYVVDVGTAFGVSVDDQAATDVVVFDGEVHVGRSSASSHKVRLTTGMSIRADQRGLNTTYQEKVIPSFDREFNGNRPSSLGPNEISLVDIICGSAPGEYRTAGSIDPEMGTWSTLPWSESKGVRGKLGTGRVVPVDWNPWVHGMFIPDPHSERMAVSLEGGSVMTPPIRGGAWGPMWTRRRIEKHLDPLTARTDRDVEGFWGAGTTTALLDRSRWVRDGIVGMHANVGITIDLSAIRRGFGASLLSFRGVLAHLEQSYVSQPFQPQAQATFQIYVDGELRYERANFCREDGDAMFGAELHEDDRLLSLISTDGNDGPIYDRVVLLDPIFEIREK